MTAAADRMLTDSLIVGAHPDDEMLWFNAIVGRVDEVVIVYGDYWAQPGLGERRRRAVAELPLRRVTHLDIAEAGTYGCANWAEPVLGEHGLKLGLEETRREMTRLAKRSAGSVLPVSLNASPARVAAHYRENFDRITRALKPRLRPGMNVFTHNPWGEYGHEDHVQVFAVLAALRERIGFRLWMSNYATERSLPLAMRYFRSAPGPYLRLRTDKALSGAIADVYRRHDCWTWSDDWSFFDEECYMEAPRPAASAGGGGPHQHLFPLNLFTIEERRRSLRAPIAATGAVALSAMLGAALMEAF
ncbi:PIG-L family deacetylase [Aureimonas jatrophae]|uniref:GlcNAc-PI de-N-acetylase n=1 Tax=Aureimonas jatrophae TaxID=1166073 RepID=A0A1H0K801_9HYPH|nr:PIG-L family deacetylase [Aureimonas jatrophae]MBB3950994.1 LmbE family N-acetylglucosaminyl deacetylase [Aureimonas jatrophae]SDO52105.1 GlcNAc-PI de-N-acetylase [Aureimonas jatrophae]